MPNALVAPNHNAPKKILHVFSSLELGGAQRRFVDYLALSTAGHSHSVYAMDGNYAALDLAKPVNLPWGRSLLVRKGNTLTAAKKARKLLSEFQPDLLITYNWGAIEWALANRFFPVCPTVHIQDGFTEDELDAEIGKRRLSRAFAYRGCTAVIVPSETLKAIAKSSWHIRTDRLKFIPNGVNIKRFSAAADDATLSAFGIDPTKQIIGTVTGLRPEKNIGRLIEAFSLIENDLPDARLVIVGGGVGMAALRMLADRVCNKGSVIFTGNHAKPEAIIPAFSLFALSSDTEQMPLSVIEAMAAGLPIVSTDVGDITKMVSRENAPYIEGRDASVLAKNIAAIVQDPNAAQIIGKANLAKAETSYDIGKMVVTYDELFTACCST